MGIFSEHPATVGESYTEHMACATSFGSRLVIAGLACLIHAILPFLFKTKGSRTVTVLYDEMVVNRVKKRSPDIGQNDITSVQQI